MISGRGFGWIRGLRLSRVLLRGELFKLRPGLGFKKRDSKPQKVGNRIKDKSCWDSLYIALKD